jgi:NAD(P)H-dependent flavin oxidoreductase YrpB (nitropropane dioxygenase family)
MDGTRNAVGGWNTAFTEAYGIELPFVSAGMGFLAHERLVAAVGEAGGLGLLGVGPLPASALRKMIRGVRKQTQRRFGVDLIVETTAFGPLTTDEHLEVCIAERVPVVVFFWTVPAARWLDRLHAAETKVWVTVGSVAQAREAVRAGADAVLAQGTDAGGHVQSTRGLFGLVPAVVDAVAPLPVIAAGAIADGRGVAAALALGAEAVCVGTRLIASVEANAHVEYKRRLLAAGTDDVVGTRVFGPEWPDALMKVIRNRVVAETAGRDDRTPRESPPPLPIGKTTLLGQEYVMPKYSAMLPTPETSGDFEEMCLAAGDAAGLVRDVLPVADIVRGMMADARAIVTTRLARMAGQRCAPGSGAA